MIIGYSINNLKDRLPPDPPTGTSEAMAFAIKSIVSRYHLHSNYRPWKFQKSKLVDYYLKQVKEAN